LASGWQRSARAAGGGRDGRRCQHFGAECLDNLGQCGSPGSTTFAGDHVRVDDRHAERGEEVGDVLLPLAMPPVRATRKGGFVDMVRAADASAIEPLTDR